MIDLIIEATKHIIILNFLIYFISCYYVILNKNTSKNYNLQKILILLTHFIGIFTLYLNTFNISIIFLYFFQLISLIILLFFYKLIYTDFSELLSNNMAMLLTISYIILTRLNINKMSKQLFLIYISIIISFFVQKYLYKIKLEEYKYIYLIGGIFLLLLVLLLGKTIYGAKLNINILGFSFQFSEYVKIIYIFFIVSSLKNINIRSLLETTSFCFLYILILILSKDLGTASIFFVIYIVILYVLTKNKWVLISSIVGSSVISLFLYNIFNHVKVRVNAWLDPFVIYNRGGYQIVQSIFAINTGGWFGLGLTKGCPKYIPVVEEDFIFSAICEEMGIFTGIFLILLYISCFIMIISMIIDLTNRTYRIISIGICTCFMIQTFLNIGGVTKFLPLTGVTLPFVSYGGNSIISSFIMFSIIQKMYIIDKK